MDPNVVRGLRIAHLIESDGPGGAERVVADLAQTFEAAGARNVVFLPRDGEGWIAERLRGTGVQIEYFLEDRAFSPQCMRQLERGFHRHRISVAHSHEFSMAVYGAWAARRAGIPHVMTMHGSRYYAGRLRRRVALRAAAALSGETIAVSDSLARQICQDLWIRRAHVRAIPNGVRPVFAEPALLREELRLGPADHLIVSVGNLYPVKGHRYLVDALALLADNHPSLHLAIAGRGGEADSLTSQAARHGLASRVHLLGLRADVSAILGAADMFVLPSVSEALPLALLEAMFARRPIVATDVGEVSAVLAHGRAGIVVEPRSAGALASAIETLLNDPSRARELGSRARARALAEYTLSRMAERYATVYTALLARGPYPVADHPAEPAGSSIVEAGMINSI
jgi:glycosyltransferase involved in cell wall biosynthesis